MVPMLRCGGSRRSGLSGSTLVTVMHEVLMSKSAASLAWFLLVRGRLFHPSGVLILTVGRIISVRMSVALAQPAPSISTVSRGRLWRTPTLRSWLGIRLVSLLGGPLRHRSPFNSRRHRLRIGGRASLNLIQQRHKLSYSHVWKLGDTLNHLTRPRVGGVGTSSPLAPRIW